MEPDGPFAVVQLRLHGGGELSVPKENLSPRFQLPPGADQALPQVPSPVGKEKYFTGSPGGAVANEPGGKHPGVVEHQAVPRPQKPGQVIKMLVAHSARVFIQRQQAGGVPPLQRGLGDKLLRELKIKVRSFQCVQPHCKPVLPPGGQGIGLIVGDLNAREIEGDDLVKGEAPAGHGVGAVLAHAHLVAPAAAVEGVAPA